MVDGDLFDKLATIASILRKSDLPFGGIQLVVTGDFFQLPPVTKGSSSVKFAFEADCWKKALKHTYNLTRVFRQTDPSIRLLSPSTISFTHAFHSIYQHAQRNALWGLETRYYRPI